jgi:propanol-preferring alcohol dehydrogenase
MRALVLDRPGTALRLAEVDRPRIEHDEDVIVRVRACGVCRTDLHVVDGDLTDAKPAVIPGHEIVGTIEALGSAVRGLSLGERIGIPWLGGTCGTCAYCMRGRENLCDEPLFTGYKIDGGYAEYTRARAGYCVKLPSHYGDAEAAPLLCAGLIGYRSLMMAGEGERLGLYGFGAAAHILTQVATRQGRSVFAFTRPGDLDAQVFARRMGATWAGGSDVAPPHELDAAIIFAPVGALVPLALQAVRKGGTVVCGGIHMSDIPAFPYRLLWGERSLRSVANLTRADALAFLELAAVVPIRTSVELFPLEQANEALLRLREGHVNGAAVLIP